MSLDESKSPAPPRRDERGVLCPQCEHLNHAGLSVCTVCGADLFYKCPHCGLQNERILLRCRGCHKRLSSRGRHHHHHHRHLPSFPKRLRLPLLQAALVLLALLIALGMLYLLNHSKIFGTQ